MNRLKTSSFLQVCIMLFGLFFGAGNLIFPPFLGKQAGSASLVALTFFAVTAIIFPILGVAAVARTKGLKTLAERISPRFALVYMISLFLAIGPGLAIPRASSIPFTMVIQPFLSSDFSPTVLSGLQLLYTLVFFVIAYTLALKPNKLVEYMGKFLSPTLIVMIIVLFLGVFFHGFQNFTEPVADYAEKGVAVTGFLEGYNTMDTLAALVFGLIISMAIRGLNVTDEKAVIKYSIGAGVVAGSFLLLVYSMLTYVGASTASLFPNTENGAQILVSVAMAVYGNFGYALMVAIFSLACLSVSIGLITSCSSYFTTLTDRFTYKQWATAFTVLSFVFANFGLNQILKLSVPVLLAIYPISLTLIILALVHNFFLGNRWVYRATIGICLSISILQSLKYALGVTKESWFYKAMAVLPFEDSSLGWLVPTLVVFILSAVLVRVLKPQAEA